MQTTAAPKPRAVKVPKWGTVYVLDLMVDEVEANIEADKDKDKGDAKHDIARGAARVLCDPDGKLIYDANNPDDVAFLGSQPWRLLRKINPQDDAEGN